MNTKDFGSKIFSRYLIGHLVAMAVFIVLLCVGIKFGLDLYTHHGQGIVVPDLKGMTYEKAFRLLEENGLLIVVSDSGYNKKLPADCILAQTPGFGQRVKEGHIIYVTVNSPSSPSFTIPDIVDNSSYREAEARLMAQGFKLTEPMRIDGEKDWVYGVKVEGRNVAAGARIPSTASVTLVVGDGTYYDEDVEQIQGLSTDDSLQIIDDTPEEEFSPSSHSPVNAPSAY